MEQYKLFLNGGWTNLKRRFTVTDPGTGEAFAEVPAATREHARTAVADANHAFKAWRSLTGPCSLSRLTSSVMAAVLSLACMGTFTHC